MNGDRHCARCGRGPLRNQVRGVTGPSDDVHAGRGLCRPCYTHEDNAGALLDWGRSSWPNALLVDEAETLRTRGLLWREVAAHLGVKKKTLDQARARHQRHLAMHEAAS